MDRTTALVTSITTPTWLRHDNARRSRDAWREARKARTASKAPQPRPDASAGVKRAGLALAVLAASAPALAVPLLALSAVGSAPLALGCMVLAPAALMAVGGRSPRWV